MVTESRMPGATDEPVRENPTVRSKFDKSHGKGLPAPHLSSPGPTMGTTNPGPRVFQAPKNVGSTGNIKTQHIPPSELGSGMAEGRHYAQAPNFAQTQGQNRSHRRAPALDDSRQSGAALRARSDQERRSA